MSSAKFRSQLLELVDSDSEDGLNGSATGVARAGASRKPPPQQQKQQLKGKLPITETGKMAPAKKTAPRGRQAANKVTKPAQKPPARRANGRAAAAEDEVAETSAPAKATGRGRKRTVAAVAAEEEEKEEEEGDDDVVMEDSPPPPSPPAKAKTARGRPKKTAREDEPNEAPEPIVDEAPPARAQRGRKAAVKKKEEPVGDETEIPETQPQQQPDEDGMHTDSEDGGQLEDLPTRHSSDPPRGSRNPAQAPSSVARRPAYTTASSDGGDPALRRRLGEMTQKYESLELRYRDLREIAVREAESNFEKLKKQSDEKTKTADQLIASLKAELAAQKEIAKEVPRLKKQLEVSEAKVDGLQARITEMAAAQSEAKTEIKALNMKLSAARNAEAAAVSKVPGSAMKGTNGSSRMVGNAEAMQQATFTAQMKEDLYSDLTGLIVRGVKRGDVEDVYDCIQTGRNGTLHFKLAIGTDSTADNFDDAEFMYMPQLDANRDRALIDTLPDYLVEEITFPRPQAAKFYARVMKALTEAVQ
ncbi:chromosome segregation protein Csm1/Pcs1-domain-containing protein [Cercophora scortea]|uniref:Chromosome segregation protein Csm1/Pcs1-domain-containing protein n=1 Tax=Cercophora scortea TaxID=314031 RepID=A0AAE0IG01_9PEZI|nr:chromosome segregation protein Csm1/Pcs1-domain-containing protein [Cercophora scortea]